MTTIGINLEQHDRCLIGRNCLQIPQPLFHSLSIGSSCCSHVFMYWLYFFNVDVRFLFLGVYIYVIGCWFLVAHSVFLIFYHAFKIQSEMTKRCKEAECWTFSGKSTHSSWKIRLLLIILGTYIQLNRAYMCPFVWVLKYFWATDTSDHRPFGQMTLRTNEPSDQCPGIVGQGGPIFLPNKLFYDGFLLMWCMPDCLCRPTGSTSFRAKSKGPHNLTSTGPHLS
jgi:hypothetical protein